MASEHARQPDDLISSSDSLAYWTSIPPTVDGMLGGYSQVSATDLKGSYLFYQKLLRMQGQRSSRSGGEKPAKRGLDCGAGIGRITEGFLSRVCDVVDVLEPVAAFAEQARKCLEESNSGACLGEVYTQSLETFRPAADHPKYHLIWIQWCAGHLKDRQLVSFLQSCSALLENESSCIVVKENLSTNREGKDIFDPEDSSVTRTERAWLRLFKDAGLVVKKSELQRGLPVRGLLPVKMWALRPG